jgi:hypothetical protein
VSSEVTLEVENEYPSAADPNTPGGAVFQEAAARKFDTSPETMRILAQAGGGAAAVAVCAAYGLSAAAPVCSWVGSKIGGAIYDGAKEVIDYCFGSEEAEKEIARRQKANEATIKEVAIDTLWAETHQQLEAAVSSLVVLHASLFPEALKLARSDVKKMLISAGVGLVPDVTNLQQQRQTNTCQANDYIVPHFERVILSGGQQKYATNIAQQCKIDENWRKVSSDDVIARFPNILAAQLLWTSTLKKGTMKVGSSLINLASSKETQLLIKQAADLRASNASLASDKEALTKALARSKEYEANYTKLKREAAAKRVAAEKQESAQYLADATANERRDKLLIGLAIGSVVAAAATAVVISRR